MVRSLPLYRSQVLIIPSKYLYNISSHKDTPLLKQVDEELHCTLDRTGYESRLGYRHRFQSRQKCHDERFNELCKRKALVGSPLPKPRRCSTARWAQHCECFNRMATLHARLRSWVPKGLNYCGTCEKFTRRKRNHKGRCESFSLLRRQRRLMGKQGYHGRPKPRARQGNLWTYRKGRGAFGFKMWKKWFNNAAMNRLEDRMRTGTTRERSGCRYELRGLKSMTVDTRDVRDGHGANFW